MDTIAQKLSAQDVIQANLNAEAEELKKLQTQVGEYERILETLKQIDMAQFDVNSLDITGIMEKFIAQVRTIVSTIEVKQESSEVDAIKRQEYLDMQQGQLQAIERMIENNFAAYKAKSEADEKNKIEAERARAEAERAREEAERARIEADAKIMLEAEKVRAEADEKIRAEAERAKADAERAREEAEQARIEADARINIETQKIQEIEENAEIENIEGGEELEDSLREFVHVESVKVYRNVQAVVLQGFKDHAKKTKSSETSVLEQISTLKTWLMAVGILLALDFIVDGITLAWTIISYFSN